MANQKLTDLTATTTPVDADLLYVVQDVATTPVSKKVTVSDFKSGLEPSLPTTPEDPTFKFLNGNRAWAPIKHNQLIELNENDSYRHISTSELANVSGAADVDSNGYLSSTDWGTFNGKQNALTFGIADNNAVEIDSATVADDDFAKFTAQGLEGRSASEVLSDIGALPVAGGTMTGAITLAENASIAHDPALSADGKYTGLTITGTAGAALAFGDLIYLDPTDSKWELADANAASAADGDSRGILGICVLAANENAATNILLNGVVRADTAFPTLTVNAPVYVSETAGDVTNTQPTTTDVVIRIVGYGLDGNSMYFNPENDFISHT
jgi:hypothetical protein